MRDVDSLTALISVLLLFVFISLFSMEKELNEIQESVFNCEVRIGELEEWLKGETK